MTPEFHTRSTDIFLAACERAPQERAAFLDRECGSDVGLRHAVENLLANDRRDAFLEEPVTESEIFQKLLQGRAIQKIDSR